MYEIILFAISSFALLIVSATMFARANDLRWRKGIHWNARLLGFILAGVAPVGIIGYDFAVKEYPSLYETIFRIGIALVFVTTPYLPPWWKWISGADPAEPINSDDRRIRADRRTALDRRRDEQP